MKLLTAREMAEMDRQCTAQFGIPSLTLMENAGRCVADAVSEMTPSLSDSRVILFCGKGNNGGDAYVVARRAAERGTAVTVYAVCAPAQLQGAAREHAEALGPDVPVVVCDELPRLALAPGTVLVDGLLILVAGAVLLTPGLITDTVGFVLLVPPTRAAVRRGLVEAFRRRMQRHGAVVLDADWSPGGDPRDGHPDDRTIDV